MDKIAITKRFLDVLGKIMETEGLTKTNVAEAIGTTKQKLSNISIKDKNEKDENKKKTTNFVSVEIVAAFCKTYHRIDANYILTGRGSMFIQEQESDDSAAMLEEAHKNLEDAMAEIKRLKEENELLRTAFTRLQSS